MKKEDNNTFPASDWFDLNFLGGFVNSDSSIKRQFNEQNFKVDDSRLSSRVLNHWYESGIITDNRPNRKGWKKFSLTEIVWVNIVFKLRSFGLDLKRIKEVKDHIDTYNPIDKTSNCPLLDFYMYVAIFSKIPIKLVVFESGQAEIVRQIDLDIGNEFGFIKEDFISIDINKLLNKLFTKKNIKADYLGYADTPKSSIIREIENSISAEDITSITIKINDDDYVIDEKFFMNNRGKAKALMSVMNFGEMIEKKSAGKSTYQVSNKKKIKRDNP